MLTTTITKVEHDEAIGYYINDKIHAYADYHDVSDKEVELEAIVQAFEQGLIHQRNHLKVEFIQHYDLPGYSLEADKAMVNHLPDSCEVLKAHYANFKK
jgi:hypothetical protein